MTWRPGTQRLPLRNKETPTLPSGLDHQRRLLFGAVVGVASGYGLRPPPKPTPTTLILFVALFSSCLSLSKARQALEQSQAQIERLPPERDVNDLQAALKHARSLGDIDASIVKASREADRRGEALTVAIEQLAPWTGSADDLRRLVLPGDEEAAAAVANASQAEAKVVEARRHLQALPEKEAELELRHAQLVRDDQGVTSEALAGARLRRDSVWQAVRAHVLGDRSLDDPRGSANELERRATEADSTADRRYFAAEQSARLSEIQQELERHALAVDQAIQALARAEADLSAATDAWSGRLGPIGLRLSPQAFPQGGARRCRWPKNWPLRGKRAMTWRNVGWLRRIG